MRIDDFRPVKDAPFANREFLVSGFKFQVAGVGCKVNSQKLETMRVALYEPEIPPNTGNIARLCAATRTPLHIVGVTGFRMDDRELKRAGLDYWSEVELHRHIDLDELRTALPASRLIYLTTKATRAYWDFEFSSTDCLVFGPETRGLPEATLNADPDRCLTIPMPNKNIRSLNLANSVGIVIYEALRQLRNNA